MDLVDLVDDNIKISNRKGSLTTTLQVLVALRFFACGSWSDCSLFFFVDQTEWAVEGCDWQGKWFPPEADRS